MAIILLVAALLTMKVCQTANQRWQFPFVTNYSDQLFPTGMAHTGVGGSGGRSEPQAERGCCEVILMSFLRMQIYRTSVC